MILSRIDHEEVIEDDVDGSARVDDREMTAWRAGQLVGKHEAHVVVDCLEV